MIKKFLASVLAGLLIVSLAGCGAAEPEAPASTTEESTTTESQSTETQEDAAEVDKSEKLLIYSNSASDGRGEWLTEKAAEAGYSIEVVSLAGGDLTNRLVAEKNSPIADLVYGLSAMDYEILKGEDLLLPYEPVWASEVDMSLGDPDGYYYPIVAQPIVLIMNESLTEVPSDWTDLAEGKFNGQYNILGLHGGSARAITTGILTRYADPDGELGISEEGWEVMKGYVQNGQMEIVGNDFVGDVISGKIPMTGLWGSGVIQYQNERDVSFNVMTPEIGVPYITEQVAIINGTQKAALAEDFINWFGSAEIQGAWTEQFGTIPVHPEALAMASEDVTEFASKVHPQNIDWAFAAENISAWTEKIELEFVL